jgi:hypothetical protein
LQAEEQEEGEEEEEEGEEEGEGEVYREREKREGRRKNPERNVRRTSREDCITRIHKGRPSEQSRLLFHFNLANFACGEGCNLSY